MINRAGKLCFDKVGEISFIARRAIEAGKSEMLGELMNENHALLQKMTVSSPGTGQIRRSRA